MVGGRRWEEPEAEVPPRRFQFQQDRRQRMQRLVGQVRLLLGTEAVLGGTGDIPGGTGLRSLWGTWLCMATGAAWCPLPCGLKGNGDIEGVSIGVAGRGEVEVPGKPPVHGTSVAPWKG